MTTTVALCLQLDREVRAHDVQLGEAHFNFRCPRCQGAVRVVYAKQDVYSEKTKQPRSHRAFFSHTRNNAVQNCTYYSTPTNAQSSQTSARSLQLSLASETMVYKRCYCCARIECAVLGANPQVRWEGTTLHLDDGTTRGEFHRADVRAFLNDQNEHVALFEKSRKCDECVAEDEGERLAARLGRFHEDAVVMVHCTVCDETKRVERPVRFSNDGDVYTARAGTASKTMSRTEALEAVNKERLVLREVKRCPRDCKSVKKSPLLTRPAPNK